MKRIGLQRLMVKRNKLFFWEHPIGGEHVDRVPVAAPLRL